MSCQTIWDWFEGRCVDERRRHSSSPPSSPPPPSCRESLSWPAGCMAQQRGRKSPVILSEILRLDTLCFLILKKSDQLIQIIFIAIPVRCYKVTEHLQVPILFYWKTIKEYKLVLMGQPSVTAEKKGKVADFQAFAKVDKISGEDWIWRSQIIQN